MAHLIEKLHATQAKENGLVKEESKATQKEEKDASAVQAAIEGKEEAFKADEAATTTTTTTTTQYYY